MKTFYDEDGNPMFLKQCPRCFQQLGKKLCKDYCSNCGYSFDCGDF